MVKVSPFDLANVIFINSPFSHNPFDYPIWLYRAGVARKEMKANVTEVPAEQEMKLIDNANGKPHTTPVSVKSHPSIAVRIPHEASQHAAS